MLGLTLDVWIRIAQVLALIVVGIWALYLYGTSRRGQVRLGIDVATRVKRDLVPGKSLLLARLTISNTSGVLWRNEGTVATLFDARRIADDGNVRLVPFAQADPFLPVYGVETESLEAIDEGRPFGYFEGQELMLEPGEQVVTELAFPLQTEELGLMAMKVRMSGRQRNRTKTAYEWGTFLYVDPDQAPVPWNTEPHPTTMESR